MGSCTDVAWSPNGHFCVTSSCYTKETKQDVVQKREANE